MSLSGIIGGAVATTAANTGNSFLNSAADYYYGKKSTKYASDLSLANSSQLLGIESLYNKKDYEWQKQLDYNYDANQYYNLAKRYSENSAKWNVTGLRNAGLNPILAATDGNFQSTYGTGSSSGSMGSASGSMSVPFSRASSRFTQPSEALRDIASVQSARASADLADTQSRTQEQLRDPTVASARADAANKMLQGDILASTRDKIDAESDSVRANTAKTLADIVDMKSNGKVSGMWNLIGRTISPLTYNLTGVGIQDEARRTGLKHFLENSAKDSDEKEGTKSKVDNAFEQFLKEQAEEFEKEQRRRRHSSIITR